MHYIAENYCHAQLGTSAFGAVLWWVAGIQLDFDNTLSSSKFYSQSSIHIILICTQTE